MKGAFSLFRFVLDAAARGERSVLVTITDVTGGSPRAAGTQMAVTETGAVHGSLSGGCIETAVAAEAQRVLASGKAEMIRFGAGSRFLDIRLPCGGGVDLLFSPLVPKEVMAQAAQRLEARIPAVLRLLTGSAPGELLTQDAATGWEGETFIVRHDPELRVVVIGHGAEPVAMARLAVSFGADVEVLSPDEDAIRAADELGVRTVLLSGASRIPPLATDAHTAVVLLFHDHNWEQDFLVQLLRQEAFFIGAMGSRAAHARRVEGLAERGVAPEALQRITAPVGLIPATRDPDTLALSVLAQIAEAYRVSTTPAHTARGEKVHAHA